MRWPFALLLASGLAACSTSPRSGADDGWTVRPNAHARFFEIAQRKEERRLITFGPGGREDTLSVLYLRPDPPHRIAVLSTPYLSYLALLHGAERICAMAFLNDVMDTLALKQLPADVADVGGAAGLDRERLVAAAPQLVIDQGFGHGTGSWRAVVACPALLVSEYLEPHPLGRAEWIRAFGTVLGVEHQADSLYAAIAARYAEVRRSTEAGAERPVVFFGSTWQGLWYLPPADSYMGQLIADAGGTHVMPALRGTSNLTLDLESVMREGMKATHFGVLLAATHAVDARVLAGGDPRLANLPSLRNGGFFGNSASHDLFGRALVEPDVVLRDLHCILHPHRCKGHHLVYFERLVQ